MNEPTVHTRESAAQQPGMVSTGRLPQRILESRLIRSAGNLMVDAGWRLRNLGPRRSGALAVALAAGAAAILFVLPMREQARELQQQLARLSGTQASVPAAVVSAPQMQLPDVEQLPAIIGELQSRAQEAGLELSTGTYRLVPARRGGPARYEIGLPVAGSYPEVRKFVESSLVSVPMLALDGISLQRSDVASPRVDVEVNFVVFVAGT